MRARRRGEVGFSLIELMIAMVVTLIVSGAIFGLMAGGQNSFKREPELTDRQQNIRSALAMIQRDIQRAGDGMADRARVFTQALNNTGPATSPGLIKNADGTVPTNADKIEIWGHDGYCPTPIITKLAGAEFTLTVKPPPCFGMESGALNLAVITNGAGESEVVCAKQKGGQDDNHMVFPSNIDINPNGGKLLIDLTVLPLTMDVLEVVRYEIRTDDADLDANNKPTPSLWRSPHGGTEFDCGTTNGTGGWQLVARGIEDMQVQYRTGTTSVPGANCPNGKPAASGWCDDPPVGTTTVVSNAVYPNLASYSDIVREVRVTLSSRTLGVRDLQGQSDGGSGGLAIRGQLTATGTPRVALLALTRATDGNGSAPQWR